MEAINGSVAYRPQPAPTLFSRPATDRLSVLSRMSASKARIEQRLAEERAAPQPNAAIIQACETWLEIYRREQECAPCGFARCAVEDER